MLEIILANWVPVLVIGAGVVLPIVAVICKSILDGINNARQSRADDLRADADRELIRLKQSMVDRGMPAAEITRVLESGRRA